MQILDAFCYLFEYPATLSLWYAPLSINVLAVIVKGNSINILCHKIDLFGRVNEFEHFNGIGVIETLQHSYLSLNSFLLQRIGEFVLLVDLQSIQLLSGPVLNKLDTSIGSLSNLFPDTIGLEATHEVVDVSYSTSGGVGRLDLTQWGFSCLVVLALIQSLPSLVVCHVTKRAWLVCIISAWCNRGYSKPRIQERAILSLNRLQLLHGIRIIVISSRVSTCNPSRPLAVCS
jgi:hypothetical protein